MAELSSFHIILSIIGLAVYIYVIVLGMFLILDNRETSTTVAWLLVFIFLPVIGPVLFLLFGRNWRDNAFRHRLTRRLKEIESIQALAQLDAKQAEKVELLRKSRRPGYVLKLYSLLYKNSRSILTVNNDIQILQNGQEKFDLLLKDLARAQKFIHMEYFIWRDDALTQKIKSVLIERAKAGVEVRIMVDSLGSFFLRTKYLKELRAAGVQAFYYFNLRSFFKIHTLNYRNHRKIIVIDGDLGYVGGMNMAKEYIDGGKRFNIWRDTHLRIEGQAVRILQAVFLTGWFNTTDEKLLDAKYFPPHTEVRRNEAVQITTSGPDSRWESIEQLYFSMIAAANKSVYIQSPYFIPSTNITAALKAAALSGLDVKIMLTGVADKKIPYWSAFTYFRELLKAGVKIYHYQKGFLHAKTVVIDSQVCSIGTANMDIRSFHLDYEINALIYTHRLAQELEADFNNDLKDCREFTLLDYKRLPIRKKIRNSFARLFTPLL